MLNYSQLFASDADYIFYALSISQQLKLTSRINIALKRVCAPNLTAVMLSQKFSEKVRDIIASDHAYQFMSSSVAQLLLS